VKAHRLVRENGLVHAQAAEDARRARATRMVVVVRSLSSTKKSAYRALDGSIVGKERRGYEPQGQGA